MFVRGSSVISTDSAASLFWDKYLEFELTHFASASVQAGLQVLPPPYTGTLIGGVYALVLSLPLRDLDKYWTSFSQKFAINYPLNYIASPQEAEEYTATYPKDIPADRATFIAQDGTQQTMTLTQYCNEWEIEQRRTLLAKREYTFRQSLGLRDEKNLFEYAISRPYFHVAPLTAPELSNWSNFLDHMETKLMRSFHSAHGPRADIAIDAMDQLLLTDTLKLYERCVIPCAQYYEFWDRYAHFLEQLGEPVRAIEVRERALVFMQRNVVAGADLPEGPQAAQAAVQECMAALGELEEKQGRAKEARVWLQQAVSVPLARSAAAAAPYLEARLAQIQFERRQWRVSHPAATVFEQGSEVYQLYTQALEALHPRHALAYTKAFTFLTLHFVQFNLNQVLFVSEEERATKVRALFEAAAACMNPEPVAAPVPTTGDGTAAAAAAAPGADAPSVVPRLPASKQYLVFWLAFVEFESTVARSPVATLVALYERALTARQPVADAVLQANPHLLAGGASGLSDLSRKQLWTSFVAMMEDRATDIKEVERVKAAARRATVAAAPMAAPALLSVLGKRKNATSPLPLQMAPTKRLAPTPVAPAYGHAHAYPPQRPAYGGGYGGGYGQPNAYHAPPPQQYHQQPPQQYGQQQY